MAANTEQTNATPPPSKDSTPVLEQKRAVMKPAPMTVSPATLIRRGIHIRDAPATKPTDYGHPSATFVWKQPKSERCRTPSPLQSAYGSPRANWVWKQPKSERLRRPSRLQSGAHA